MNNQQFPQYPAPTYSFAPNPYPAQQAPYQFQAPPLQQQHQQQQQQQQHQLIQPPQLRQHPHQQPQYLHNFSAPNVPQPPPLPRRQEPRAAPTNALPVSTSRSAQKRQGPPPPNQVGRDGTSRDNGVSPQRHSPAGGPGAPPPQSNTPDNIEEELMNALQGDGSSRGAQAIEHDDQDDENDQDEEVDENEPVFHLPPPPEGNYANEEDLEQQLHAWTLGHGYECVRRASKKNASGLVYKRYYHCARHGKQSAKPRVLESERKRAKRKHTRLGCPMSLAAVAVDPANPTGEWQIRHRKTHHNHAAEDAVKLTGHRRRARGGDVERIIDSLFSIGTPTTQVLKFLQKNHPSGLFTRTDVANMKLKFNQYGTCIKDGLPVRSVTAGKGGVPSACQRCRQKRVKCNSERPKCGTCITEGTACEYDHEPQTFATSENNMDQFPADINGASISQASQEAAQPAEHQPQQAQPQARQGRQGRRSEEDVERAHRIMSEIQSFQAEHVRPTRLSLESSAVELVAASACGSGDLYKLIPTLISAVGWPRYSSLMIEASMKENTYDVLTGAKSEPSAPASDCEVEVWNEYVKQLAIYKRRNDMLLASIWGTLAPTFKTRVARCKRASQAWNLVEDMCQPHGSDQAFLKFSELHSITLQTSEDLNDYTSRIEQAYRNVVRVRMYQHSAQDTMGFSSSISTNAHPSANGNLATPGISTGSTIGKRNRVLADPLDVFPEESLCFLFLTNLGPSFRAWAENTCATNNIGGFGTGPKLGFKDLSRMALEKEASRRRGNASGGDVVNGQARA